MKQNARNNIENILVEYLEAKYGWIIFKVTAGEQVFEGRFSDVWDPLIDFKHWLEAISIGVQQTSFDFDAEGPDYKFDFNRESWNREVLTISNPYKNDQFYIKAKVDRKQIVKAFYSGLLEFAKSENFKKEWEIEYIKERLCCALKMDENQLIDSLLELDKKILGETLFKIDPIYTFSYPTAEDKKEEIGLFVDEALGKGISKEHQRIETANEWNIPDDYDTWSMDNKRKFIINCINEKTFGRYGTKIKDFKSSLIENYINE